MSKLQRYIGGQLLVAMLGVLLLIVGLDALSTVIDELEDITDTYTFIDVLVYVGFTLPRRAHEFVPFAALIGALVGLGKLASSSELTVAQTSGLSLRQIGMMVLQPALLLALGGFALGEFVTPLSEQLAVSHRALAQRQEQGFVGAAGVWSRDGDTFVHVEAVQRQGVIYGVQLLSFDSERRLTQSVRAERGSFQEGYWLLEQVEKNGICRFRVAG
ncbi:MAG: LptF/LptG family permease, partial [Proteobacteria bacterium]|nr:LptF/LptG family permease [Pseudomonadota bacterium]